MKKEEKQCTRCKEFKTLDNFYKGNNKPYSNCKPCWNYLLKYKYRNGMNQPEYYKSIGVYDKVRERANKRLRERKKTEKGLIAKVSRATAVSREKDPDHNRKANTREKTLSAIRRGKIIRKNCDVCGREDNVQAHHDNYDNHLDIRWLCRIHHGEYHSEMRKKNLKEVMNNDIINLVINRYLAYGKSKTK